ncbi:ATP-binding protein [Halobacteriovorax marinus]|uniref:ATP-binding protein n=1 Tax=Halobacteriovorax marinus TaxID=97084 RepID=UPI003A94B2B9
MNENTSLSNEKKPFSSLSKIIILKIIAISSLVTVISTGIQLYRDYSQNVSKVDNDIKRVSNLIVPELSYNLWHLDLKALKMQLHSLSSTGEFTYVEINYDGQTLSSGTEDQFIQKKEKTWPLMYSYKGEERELGTLRVVTDLEPYIEHVLNTALFILTANFIKTFIVAFVMIYILRGHVMVPLNVLSTKLKDFNIDNLDKEDIDLNRKPSETIDELDIVLYSVNKMKGNLIHDIERIERDRQEKEELIVKLNQSQKMEALGRLSGGIAHDFNNILHLISGSAEQSLHYLESNKLDKIKKYLGNIVEFSERGDKLIRQILTYTHQKKVEYSKINLVNVVRTSLDMMRSTLPANIEIDYTFDQEVDILGDITQMQQIIMNFCTNSRDSIDKKNGYIKVRTQVNHIKNEVQLIISDNGSGIPDEVKEKIYEPYFSTKPINKGTGMGLSIIHSIIEQMNGRIELISEIGEGAKFIIFLPVFSDGEDLLASELNPNQRLGEISLKGRRVLILDDEEIIANMHKDFVEEQGAEVLCYTSPLAALAALKTGLEVDVILTDLSMPEMSGFEFAKAYSESGGEKPIILLTGHEEKVLSENDISSYNIEEVLLKPINMEELLEVISSI